MSRAVMTIHGFLTDTKDFGRLYDYLDFYDEVVPCEVPGHNGELDFTKFTVESTLVEVLNCYDKLKAKYDEVDVIGFSMGGALASFLAISRDVRKCVLMAPANKYLNPRFVFDAMKYYIELQQNTYKSTKGKLHQKVSAIKESMRPHQRNISVCLKLEFDRILPNLNMHTYRVFSKLIEKINKTIELAPNVKVPTLIIRGALDELVPQSAVDYLVQHFDNCETQSLADIGHGMLFTNRDNVIIPMIVQFLSDGEVVPEVPFREV